MIVSFVVAASTNHVIGVKNALPWHLPGDMKFFRDLTTGHPVIMGRKTWESIEPRYRPLAKRRNIVVTRNPNFKAEGADVALSVEEALALCKPDDEVFVIGGASLYAEFFARNLVDVVYLTRVKANLKGDAFFQMPDQGWKLMGEKASKADDKNKYSYTFQLWCRQPMNLAMEDLVLDREDLFGKLV